MAPIDYELEQAVRECLEASLSVPSQRSALSSDFPTVCGYYWTGLGKDDQKIYNEVKMWTPSNGNRVFKARSPPLYDENSIIYFRTYIDHSAYKINLIAR